MKRPLSEESVTDGNRRLGQVEQTERGFEAFGPEGAYLATFATLPLARRALFEMRRDGSSGLLQGGPR